MRNSPSVRHLTAVTLAGTALGLCQATGAQADAEDTNEPVVEEVVVTVGSRARDEIRSEELAVPADVYREFDFENSGEQDLGAALSKLAPSFNYSRNSIGDGGLLNPATLRGMSPDQTLVLINGKRRHGMAWLRVLDGVIGWGTGGTDLRAIPMAAVGRVEVLRDGAAAQYGSDAIAGVINIVLKEDADRGELTLYGGTAGGAGGDRLGATVTGGFGIGDGGFVHITGEWHDEHALLRNGGNGGFDPNYQDRLIVDSSPEHENRAAFINAALPVSDTLELYAFGGASRREGLSSGAYRFRYQYWEGVQTGAGGPGPGWDVILPAAVNFHNRNAHPVYPQGFLPYEESRIEDRSLVFGARRDTAGWALDFSAAYGWNEFKFGVSNSINASVAAQYLADNPMAGVAEIMGNAGPRSGDSGAIEFDQLTFNFDARREFDNGMALAAGLEHRRESYQQRAGDEASWSCGLPHVDDFGAFAVAPDGTPIDGAVAACGFQGYPGYSPRNERMSDDSRSSQAAYVDLAAELSWLSVSAALRAENYSDAGAQSTGRVAARVPLGDDLALRAAFSTGFRAPSLSQRRFNSVVFVGSEEGLTTTFVANEGHAIARAFGVDALEHETAENVSAGIVYAPADHPLGLRLAADFYRTNIDDRVVRSLGIGCAAMAACANENVATAAFFFNGVNTRTQGVDLTAQLGFPAAGGSLLVTAGAHANKTEIEKTMLPNAAPAGLTFANYFGGWAEELLERGQPRRQANLTVDWTRGGFGLTVRANHYGETIQHPIDTGRVEVDAGTTVDLEGRATAGAVQATVGIDNVFDELPTELAKTHLSNILWGIRYPNDTPFGLAGRFVYVRLSYAFD